MTLSRRLIATLLLALLALGALPAVSAEHQPGVVILDPALERLPLGSQLLYLPDLNRQYTLEQIVALNNDLPWEQEDHAKIGAITEGGLYWIKITLRNPDDKSVELLLQTEYPSINVADLFTQRKGGLIQEIYADAGHEDRFSNRPVPHRNLINRINIPPNDEVALLWRIDSEPMFHFRASLWNPSSFNEWDLDQQLLHGIIYGILLVMVFYNLFLFFSTREKSYFFYIVYVASILYLIAADSGHIYQYLAPDKIWAKQPIYVIIYALNSLMFGQFTISFLELRKRSRVMLWLIQIFAGLATLLPFAVLITNNFALVLLATLIAALLYLAALAAGIEVRRQGVISAGHFVIAILILAFCLIASNMASVGLIESTGITGSLFAVGATLMMVFFSLALADRINQLKREVTDVNNSLLKSIEEKTKAKAELIKLKEQRIKLEQATSQAKRESRAKSDFLATMSHEIRTPMYGVLGMSELLKNSELDENQAHYVSTIEHSGKALLAIINDLQDFAKIEAGQMELEVSSFNLETLIDDCVSTFALQSVEKNLNFIADLDPAIDPVLRGDATKLQQIILNLLNNAFKFTDRGDIVLLVRATGKPAVNSVELKFEVRDSGIGLTEAEQKRLFTPFQHADESTYGRYGGSGLGLAISKQLVELMDGKIGVSSEPAVGSCFWFSVRLHREEQPDAGLLKPKSTLLIGKSVLLAGTNPISADIISRLLTSWQMQVEHCDSLEQAINAATHRHFDILLCDSDIDGIAFAQQLQQAASSGKVILMTAANQIGSQHQLQELGIELILEKPITTALMHDMLKRALGDHSDSSHYSSSQNGADFNDSNSNGTKATPVIGNAAHQTIRVLVVEDNPVNQLVIQGLLKQLGIKQDHAANGLEALKCFDKQTYDLILMDCEMPEMDGYQATAQIRIREQRSDRSPVVIIGLSAHARSDYQQRAQEAGMDDYLTKPITLSELTAAIAKFRQKGSGN